MQIPERKVLAQRRKLEGCGFESQCQQTILLQNLIQIGLEVELVKYTIMICVMS